MFWGIMGKGLSSHQQQLSATSRIQLNFYGYGNLWLNFPVFCVAAVPSGVCCCIKYATCWARAGPGLGLIFCLPIKVAVSAHGRERDREIGRERHGYCCGMFYLSLLQIAAAFFPPLPIVVQLFLQSSILAVVCHALLCCAQSHLCLWMQGREWGGSHQWMHP